MCGWRTGAPETVAQYLSDDELKLYELIWKRTVASQMESAVLDQVSAFVEDLSRLRDVSVVLHAEMRTLRDQLKEAYEVVSLGLTAEALSHEILNVADQLLRVVCIRGIGHASR